MNSGVYMSQFSYKGLYVFGTFVVDKMLQTLGHNWDEDLFQPKTDLFSTRALI